MSRPLFRLVLVWAVVATVALLVLVVGRVGPAGDVALEEREAGPPEEAEPLPDRLTLARAGFDEIPGWREDSLAEALPALRRSCRAIGRLPASVPVAPGLAGEVGGRAGDWRSVCRRARQVGGDPEAVRAFFEAAWVPFAVGNRGESEGLFTGYYEPTLHGSRRRSDRYSVPLYTRPSELVSVDLGRFREDLEGRRIAGRLDGSRVVPFSDRSEIRRGALGGRGLELVWVDDPVDAFFLEIQGSGRVEMDDGSVLRLGYADQNGHPYFAIGRELIERGEIPREEMSMQAIRRWLEAHPEEADEVMEKNASYVFFRELSGEGPLGAQGVALVPGRSLAVDRSFHPLGAPMFVEATRPAPGEAEPVPFERLMIAQDTGGAIRGPVRGDVFWGPGDEAREIAGAMQNRGRLWILLPKEAVERGLPDEVLAEE